MEQVMTQPFLEVLSQELLWPVFQPPRDSPELSDVLCYESAPLLDITNLRFHLSGLIGVVELGSESAQKRIWICQFYCHGELSPIPLPPLQRLPQQRLPRPRHQHTLLHASLDASRLG